MRRPKAGGKLAAGLQIYLMRAMKNLERHSLDTMVRSIDRDLLQHALLPFSQGNTNAIVERLHLRYRTYEDDALVAQKDQGAHRPHVHDSSTEAGTREQQQPWGHRSKLVLSFAPKEKFAEWRGGL